MSKTIEERVASLEQELNLLKQRTNGTQSSRNWIAEITGSFADDADFDEIVRLGKELRNSDRPQENQ